MSLTPLVSIITPTYNRKWFLLQATRWIGSQTYSNYEWLILDDSPEPCQELAASKDPRIRYQHTAERSSIGGKRNRLVELARGDLIAHMDDDDYYSPQYLQAMVGLLQSEKADFVKLSGYFLYDLRHDFFGYWELRRTEGLQFGCYANVLRVHVVGPEEAATLSDNYLGYGFSYLYRRSLWGQARFGDCNLREESDFTNAIRGTARIHCADDGMGLVLHLLHGRSTSSCHPQYRLPRFLLPGLFPGADPFLNGARAQQPAPAPTQVVL